MLCRPAAPAIATALNIRRRRLLIGGLALPLAATATDQRIEWTDIELIDGRRLISSELHANAVVAQIWASWCPFCGAQNPHVQKLYDASKDRGLRVIAFSIDKSVQAARAYIAKRGYTFPVAMTSPQGPAGLAAAHDLTLFGYDVTVFEAAGEPGGMMRFGIPEYRLPRTLLRAEIDKILSLGASLKLATPLTADLGLRELRAQGFEAVFLSVGVSRGPDLQVPGVELDGVVKAVDYLLNVNRGYRMDLGRRVVVIGGGFVAFDAARTALRAGEERARAARGEGGPASELDRRGAGGVSSVDPDLFSGVDPERIATSRKALLQTVWEPLRQYENLSNWCVVATSTPAWARKVFPDLTEQEAIDKLWEAIFKACRIDVQDPVSAWQEHVQKLIKYKEYLNAKRYTALHSSRTWHGPHGGPA